jgi:nucleotidyltransferase/DNA polymerase involved in DNA repair
VCLQCCNCYLIIQAVSCDEAFLDVTHSKVEDPELLASSIRKEIYETTGCRASAGIAGNMLIARIATRTAKPNGQYHITPERVCFGVFCYLLLNLQERKRVREFCLGK